MHKCEFQSSANDFAPMGYRTTVCGLTVPSIEVHNIWKKVTCKECLTWNGLKSELRKGNKNEQKIKGKIKS